MKYLWKTTILGIIFVIFLLIWIFVIGISSGQTGPDFNKKNNAIWLEHKWVDTEHTVQEIQELIITLQKNDINTVFIHSGPYDTDGNIDPLTYSQAPAFLEIARRFGPEINYQAWLGQLRFRLNLSSEEVRRNVAKQAMIMTQMVGFDGVHINIEPVWDEDLYFIQTLKKVKDVMPEEKVLSVSLSKFIPKSTIWFFGNIYDFQNYNSEINYKNVSEYVYQIVVMAYDTGITSERMYRWFVREQTIWLTRLLEGKEVFIGIPAYEDVKEGFDPEIENIRNGLRGVINGLSNLRSREKNFSGVAIYSYWEMTEEKWDIYRELWLDK